MAKHGRLCAEELSTDQPTDRPRVPGRWDVIPDSTLIAGLPTGIRSQIGLLKKRDFACVPTQNIFVSGTLRLSFLFRLPSRYPCGRRSHDGNAAER